MEFYLELLFTGVLSVLLAFLLGKLFSVPDDAAADRAPQQSTNVSSGEAQGNDPLRCDRAAAVAVEKCQDEKGFEVDEVKSDEISARKRTGEVPIERFLGDTDEISARGNPSEVKIESLGDDLSINKGGVDICEEEGAASAQIDGLEENRFETSTVEDDSLREMEAADEPQFGARLEREKEVERSDPAESECRKDVAELREEEEEEAASKEETEGSQSRNDELEQPSLLSEDEEWEGIEQTELQKCFCRAAAYVGSEGGEFALPNLSDAEQMQLYGLHKVATEGPCYEPQPMALKVSARAKWHSWQILGNMNPDVAMEEYTSLLSEKVPEWMGERSKGVDERHKQSETALSEACIPDICSNIPSLPSLLNSETERREECSACTTEEIKSASAEHTGQGLARID